MSQHKQHKDDEEWLIDRTFEIPTYDGKDDQ